jgi:peptidoglycan/xylan/chitin deacetylase (PgdA/CDA1 family)
MNSMKRLIKTILGIAFREYCSLFNVLKGKSFILMYHRVCQDKCAGALYEPAMFVTDKTLKMHINELSNYFEFLPLEEIDNKRDSRFKPSCVLTFDDGWADNFDYALPLLIKHNVPATIFVTVNYIGKNRNFWFHDVWYIANHCLINNLSSEFFTHFKQRVQYSGSFVINEISISSLIESIKDLAPDKIDDLVNDAFDVLNIPRNPTPTMLNWDQVHDISRTVVSIGSHGMNHYILTNIDSDLKKREIGDAIAILKERITPVSNYFCYPNGNYDDETIDVVREAGFKGAIGTKIGYNTSATNNYCLNRIAIHEDISSTVGLLWFRIFQGYIHTRPDIP